MLSRFNLISRSASAVMAPVFFCLFCVTAHGADVPSDTALQVAQGVLQHHVALFGHWNGSLTPAIGDVETVRYDAESVAFNYKVRPSGHVLVATADELNPVPLYSTTSDFIPLRSGNPNAVESWIVPEMKDKVNRVKQFRRRAAFVSAARTQSVDRSAVKNNWTYFKALSGTVHSAASRSLVTESGAIMRGATVSPLLSTAWGQDAPYNLQTPDDNCSSGNTLTGCVATSWAQVLDYWQWPVQGVGSHSYSWTGDSRSETLSVDFAVTYDWASMPDVLSAASSDAAKNALSLLMYHLGVATEMDFGCDSSGSLLWADEILDIYFKYKSLTEQNNRHDRASGSYTAAQWFELFKTELDADPPRPVIFSIGAVQGWHEVVVDGYQDGPPSMVHINFGWSGSYDGYYNISDDAHFDTGAYDWDVTNDQVMVVGIEPDNNPPVVDAGQNQSIDEEISVQLSGSATDPEGIGISSCLWTQVSGQAVTISDETTLSPTITTPNIDSDTADLVFQLRANDANRAYATDTVTITVSNTDGSVASVAVASSGGGSSGGCFIGSLP